MLLPLLGLLLTAPARLAQGATDYLNFETPQVKPIAVGTVGTRTVLMICNTPDNSVELYDLTTNPDAPVFLHRIPVGQEPVSVVHHSFTTPSARHMLYTANWLGDSVTYVELFDTGGTVSFSILGERRVTNPTLAHFDDPNPDPEADLLRGDDEPMHIAVLDDGSVQSLIVTKATASSYSRISAFDPDASALLIQDNSGACITLGGANVIMTANAAMNYAPAEHPTDGQFPFGLRPAVSTSGHQLLALKEPRTVLRRPGTREYWVLGHQGGGSKVSHTRSTDGPMPEFDFDVWGSSYAFNCTTPPTFTCIRGLGTTNFNMAFDPDGEALYVVGTDALNDKEGNMVLLDEPTGFVRTMLYRVSMDSLSGPHGFRDLNDGAGSSESLAHATDVDVYQAPGSTIESVFVTAFNSDRFGVIDYDTSTDTWSTPRRCSIAAKDRAPQVSGIQGAAGPRGLAVFDPGTVPESVRVYILNRLDNTFVVIDPGLRMAGPPVAPTVITPSPIALRVDPVPSHIRNGQRFLYSTQFSGSKFVACASCHVDARSDQLQWRLSVPAGHIGLFPSPGDLRVLEASEFTAATAQTLVDNGMPNDTMNANPKGPMVTQSLQGLLNFEVLGTLFNNPTGNIIDDLVSNAPYHWRGDKDSFRHFNEAFVNLQDMMPVNNPGTEPDGGLRLLLTVPVYNENQAFETFINSISYPPNPLQPRQRVFSGELPSTENPDGTLGQKGLRLFHETPSSTFGGRSCVQCHFLPEGSNNRITCFSFGLEGTDPEGQTLAQPMETPALRGLTQKDGILQLNGLVPPAGPGARDGILTGDLGTGREGLRGHSRSDFIGDLITVGLTERNAMGIFMRELDHGVAPVVGFTATIPGDSDELDLIEDQADQGNCGIAVHGVLEVPEGGPLTMVAYWYRFNSDGTRDYKQVGGAAIAPSELVADVDATGERLVFRAVPLGSERRVAYITGSGELPYSGSAPSPQGVRVVGTSPNTAYEQVPSLLRNWKPTGAAPFVWAGALAEPLSLRVLRAFQLVLSASGTGVLVQHDAPRRLQLVGTNLLQGARIRLKVPDVNGASRTLIMPIYPTQEMLGEQVIWETAVEFDPLALYMLMLGGPADAEVICVLSNGNQETPALPAGQLAVNCAPSPLGVTYELDAQNVGGAWIQQTTPTGIPYPKVGD